MNLRGAFTLIEVMAALMIVAMLAAAVCLSSASSARSAGMDDALRQLRSFDHSTRQLARTNAQAKQIVFDLSEQRLRRLDARTQKPEGRELKLPPDCVLEEVRTKDRTVAAGLASLPVSPRGLSPTYAMRLRSGSSVRWIATLGLSGQTAEISDENVLQEFLHPRAARDDVD